jgi:hypothetical protein
VLELNLAHVAEQRRVLGRQILAAYLNLLADLDEQIEAP